MRPSLSRPLRSALPAAAVLLLAGSALRGAGSRVEARNGDDPARHAFAFTRGIYSESGRGWGRSWAIDYPKADRQFLTVLRRLTILDAYDSEHAVALDDPELRRYPFVYMLEVGDMALTPEESAGLRSYLLSGGFAFIDDFWGTWQWQNFAQEMRRVLPEYPIVDLPLDHPIFSSFYRIEEILQVPSINNIRRGRTWEQDGYDPFVRAVFDDTGRLMMLINGNTDLGDAWEWAEQPDYPLKYSTFAYQMGANAIVYAMSH
ncbi:MAG TPA: DUF4159 domain-containing protein [Longimicrobiales bacterium]